MNCITAERGGSSRSHAVRGGNAPMRSNFAVLPRGPVKRVEIMGCLRDTINIRGRRIVGVQVTLYGVGCCRCELKAWILPFDGVTAARCWHARVDIHSSAHADHAIPAFSMRARGVVATTHSSHCIQPFAASFFCLTEILPSDSPFVSRDHMSTVERKWRIGNLGWTPNPTLVRRCEDKLRATVYSTPNIRI